MNHWRGQSLPHNHMTTSPRWLSTLQRIREHQLDVALGTLAQQLRVTESANAAVQAMSDKLKSATRTQQQGIRPGLVDIDQVRQAHECRLQLVPRLEEAHRQLEAAQSGVCDAQQVVSQRDANFQILQRLSERLRAGQRIEEQRQVQHFLSESAVSLSNGQGSA